MIPYVYYFASFIQNKKIEVEECFWVVLQRVPSLRAFWDLEKNVLLEICVSGPVANPPLTQKSPTCMYISQNPG